MYTFICIYVHLFGQLVVLILLCLFFFFFFLFLFFFSSFSSTIFVTCFRSVVNSSYFIKTTFAHKCSHTCKVVPMLRIVLHCLVAHKPLWVWSV